VEKQRASLHVDIVNSEGVQIGKATLTEAAQEVRIQLIAEKLEPGKKVIHIHETGKCEKPDFKTAGAHYNPYRKEHGFHNRKGNHAEDLPNIEIWKEGKGTMTFTISYITLQKGEKNSLLDEDGSAIIIHEKEDDYKTDSVGNVGNRIACGAILLKR
jgi:Cu-Zn family superoxide dismutase